MNINEVIINLEEHSVKPSMQRIKIMEYLMEHRTHPNVDEIHSALSPQLPTLSKTTVYNTLKLFVNQRAAMMLTIDDKNICFDADTSLHAHFLCTECGKVYDLPFQGEPDILGTTTLNGNLVKEIHQYYRGICKNCLKKNIIN